MYKDNCPCPQNVQQFVPDYLLSGFGRCSINYYKFQGLPYTEANIQPWTDIAQGKVFRCHRHEGIQGQRKCNSVHSHPRHFTGASPPAENPGTH